MATVTNYKFIIVITFSTVNISRGFIKFLCRRSVEFYSRVFLVFLMKESKKRRRKQPGKLMAKSRSQPVNLTGARPLMNPPALVMSKMNFIIVTSIVWCSYMCDMIEGINKVMLHTCMYCTCIK